MKPGRHDECVQGHRDRRHQHLVVGGRGRQAVNTAKETLRDLRVAEVVEQDLDLGGGEVMFRTKLSISFKYQAD